MTETTDTVMQAPRGDHAAVRSGRDVAECGGRRRAMRHRHSRGPRPSHRQDLRTDRTDSDTPVQIAEEYSGAVGRKFSYVYGPVEPWERELRQSGMSPHVAAHLITMAALHRQNGYDRHTDHVEKLTGSPSMSIVDFVRMHAAEFERKGGRA